MANTVFKLRRSTVPGKVPNTDILSIGELALNLTDRKLYSSDGTNIFETGSNLTSLSVFSDIKVGNSTVNTVINSSSLSVTSIIANGSVGNNQQVLASNGSSIYWADAGSSSNAAIRVYQSFTAFEGQTQFDVSGGFTNNQIDVFYNGIHLSNLEFTGNGSSVVLTEGAPANSIIEVVGYKDIDLVTVNGAVISVGAGDGLTGGTITSTGTISVLANTGILVSAAGVQLDTNYVETLSVNSSLFANSATFANSSLFANSATFSNSATFLSGNTVTTNSIALSISSLGINSNGIISNTFQVGTSTYFVSNGNVGIDTNAPISSLHVSSNKAGSTSDWYDPANYAATIHHNINGTSRYGLLVSNRWRASENFVFAVDGRFTNGGGTVAEDTHTPYFIVRGDGNVGIGTASPASVLQVAGSITPTVSNTHDLGTSSLRWRNIYTNDLHLNNGIGDYTIVEGEDDLFLYNNKKNKVYKFVLLEVDANVAPKKALQ